jgi:hypothetical protein
MTASDVERWKYVWLIIFLVSDLATSVSERIEKATSKIAAEDRDQIRRMAVAMTFFAIACFAVVTPIMVYRESDHWFARLLWTDGDKAMKPIRCALRFGWRC